MELNLEELKSNHKTSFLASEYERLLREKENTEKMLEEDPSMKEMIEEKLKNIILSTQFFWITDKQ